MQKNGVRYGDRVLIELPKSREYIDSLFGCWFMGAVSIPLTDDYPKERLAYINEDSACSLRINAEFIRKMDMALTVEPIIAEGDSEGLIIYTSGSTGNPKGVIHDFNSMSATALRDAVHVLAPERDTNGVRGMVAPFTFIVGVDWLLSTMSLSKHLVLVPDEIRMRIIIACWETRR